MSQFSFAHEAGRPAFVRFVRRSPGVHVCGFEVVRVALRVAKKLAVRRGEAAMRARLADSMRGYWGADHE